MRLQQYLYTQLPVWARPDNPVLRMVLHRTGRRRRLLRWLLTLVGIGLLLWMMHASYRSYQNGFGLGVGGQNVSGVYAVLYFPLLILQLFTITAALVLTSNMLWREQMRGTWEAVKITSHGAELAMRARWAASFYQMRWLLLALMIPRLIFTGQMLASLTDYQGYHLDLYITGITPGVSLESAIVLLAALMTAALLQPLVIVGLNAAIGLFLSTVFSTRPVTLLAQIMILLIEIMAIAASLSAGWGVLNRDPSGPLAATGLFSRPWQDLLFMSAAGDLSLRFMDLPTFFQAWTDVDYGVFLGVAVLGVVLLEAILTNVLLLWAAHRASRPAWE